LILSSTSVDFGRAPRRALVGPRAYARAVALVIGILVAGRGGTADADVSPSARALARSLFEDARSLMAEKKFAEACPKLAESLRLDPAAGTQLNLAFCHEGEGRTATAWAEYNDALTQARRDGRPEREEFISSKLRGLSGKLMLLAIALAPGADVPALEVSLDGAIVGSAALGVASPVDPGVHTLEARAPGFAPWRVEVRVAVGDPKRVVTVPPLATGAPPSAGESKVRAQTTPAKPSEPSKEGARERRTVGVVLLGAGLASASVGLAFGADAVAKWRDRNAECAHGCSQSGVRAGDAATTSAWVSDFTIGVGVAALAAGAYLMLAPASNPHRDQTASAGLRAIPIVTGSEVGLGLGGVIQ
jgi:hypothetical protein